MLLFIESILPSFIAILSLALFTQQTKKLCYAAVSLSIMAELVPITINSSMLFSCTACIIAMIILDTLQTQHILKLSSIISRR